MINERLRNPEPTDPPTHEVEVRCLLTPQQYEELRTTLHEQAEFLGEEHITDVYFCPNATKSFQEIEMDKVGSYSLRLRDSKKGSKEKVDLNMKVITDEGDHNAWSEHEIEVSSVTEAKKMLGVLGFKPYFSLEKQRTNFAFGGMTISLEDINDFGHVMEIEILTERAQAKKAKESIKRYMGQNGIKDGQIVPKSVTNMLMRQKATF